MKFNKETGSLIVPTEKTLSENGIGRFRNNILGDDKIHKDDSKMAK